MFHRFTWLAILVILLLSNLSAVAAESNRGHLAEFLPGAYEGFTSEISPMFCVGVVNLTFIHNGGYLEWVDMGVQTALTQTFTKDGAYYTATIYAMNSLANASGILKHFQEQTGGMDAFIGDEGFEHSALGMNYIYFRIGDIFITLDGHGESSMEAIRQSASEIHQKAMPEYLLPGVILGGLLLLIGRKPG
jgi:hypothetical protein